MAWPVSEPNEGWAVEFSGRSENTSKSAFVVNTDKAYDIDFRADDSLKKPGSAC